MLTPEQIAGLPQNVTHLFEQLSEDIMQDMARRVAKTGFLTETALWQYQRLRELYGNEIYGLVLQKMQVATKKTAPELHALFLAAGEDAIDFDDIIYRAAGFETADLSRSARLMQVLEAELAKSNKEFENLTRTTALGTQQAFISACDRAHLQVMSGAFSYESALRIAISDLAESGAMVLYPSGARTRLDVAARRCVVTGMNQTAAQMQFARADEFSCDLVETTAHAGARPEHVEWQGKVFSRSGEHADYPDFLSSTGYGTGPGLCGWNCRHNFFPFFEGISARAYADEFLEEMANATVSYNGEKLPLYEAAQLQRALERKVRAAKRGVIGAESAGVDSKAETAKLRRLQADLRSFTKETKLSRDYFRERVQEFKTNASRDKFVLPKLPKGVKIDSSGVKLFPITEKSIKNIGFVKIPGFATRHNILLQEAHKDLLRFVKNQSIDVEAIAYYDMDFKLLSRYMGEGGHVKGTWYDIPHIAMHNHPSGGTFTHTDIDRLTENKSMQMISVVGNDGKVYILKKSGKYSGVKIDVLFKKLINKHPNRNSNVETYLAFMNDFFEEASKYGLHYDG